VSLRHEFVQIFALWTNLLNIVYYEHSAIDIGITQTCSADQYQEKRKYVKRSNQILHLF